LIASIFGMNVEVPGQGHIVPFWVIIVAMIAIGGGMIAFFRRRRWL
jgi:magnesium transporter